MRQETNSGDNRNERVLMARRVGVVLVGFAVLVTAISFFFRMQTGQLELTAGPAVATVVAFIGTLLIFRDRVVAGMALLLLAYWGAVIYSITQTAGFGLLLAFASFIITSLLVVQTFPADLARRGFIGSGIITIAAILLELLWPLQREIPPNTLFIGIPAAMGIGIIGLAYTARQRFAEFSLQVRLIVANTFVVVLAVLGVTLFISVVTRNTLTDSAGQDLNNVAENRALALGELLGRQVSLLQTLSFNRGLQIDLEAANAAYPEDEAQIQAGLNQLEQQWQAADLLDRLIQVRINNASAQDLAEFRNSFREHLALTVTDQEGAVVAATGRTDRYVLDEEPWWPVASSGRFYVSDPYLAPEGRSLQIDMATPVYANESSAVIGVLHTVYSLRDLRGLLESSEAELGEASHLDLVLPDGRAVEFDGLEVEMLPTETYAGLVDNRNRPYAQFEFETEPSLVAQAPVTTLGRASLIAGLNWYVVAHQARDVSLANVATIQRILLLAGLSIIGVSSIAAVFLGRTLTRPINALTEAARRVAAGDLTARAYVDFGGEIGLLANTFNEMTDQVNQTLVNLEERVANRTQALATSIDVSRRLSTILDQKQLIADVVEEVRAAFDYYHVHIYLFDAAKEKLVMSGGTGEAGQAMIAANHQIPKGKGLVGRASQSGQPIFVPDVADDPNWLPNPLLPDTKSEVAIPVAVGDEVLGVLDVQDDETNGLTEDDVVLLESIAGQVAIALQNARVYQNARQQAAREARINEIGQKIQNALTVESVLQIAARELGETLQPEETRILIRPYRDRGNGNHEQ